MARRRFTVDTFSTATTRGASPRWLDTNLPRYTAEDFAARAFFRDEPANASVVDWPWTYDEFQPYFERAEREWGVSGKVRQCAAQEPTRDGYEYPMPPLRPHASTPFLMRAFARGGMTPYLSPRGINSRTYDGRPGCPFCGYCQNFGCAVNDRASSTNTVLARALGTGLCELRTGHCATRIVHERGRVVGVAYKTEPGGPERVVKAPRVLVSIQAIESARLFLLSEIPDPNRLIGRYLTYHTKGNAELTFKDQPVWDEGELRVYQPRTALGSLQLRDLYVIRDSSRPELGKGGKFSIYDPLTVAPPIRTVTRTGFAPRKPKDVWGSDLVERLVELRDHGGVSFSFTGETLSMYDNRVELDDRLRDPWGLPVARVHYRHHPYDLAISEYCLARVVQLMVDAGGELRRLDPQGEANEGYGHNHGTLRAGVDPGAAVLDGDCQSHTVRGLYVLDCAFMPTAGASNPSLTLIANAFRVCERLP
ncbi:GMC oxidoreductase [Nannocystis radixulma]|uniref:GMC family oxidoreductase n=1 Tax=Nannocystis radixulma TaxID=2995305 RepID=A0ABT5AWY8_9BACT|nr:GMC family oxidoreductase [Nannocystis radixulma]MDC0666360.1 GMC family oxidoreductase [Nannocystis radixulma]